MISSLYSTGGAHTRHPMFMPIQSASGASPMPYMASFNQFPLTALVPNGFSPRFPNGFFSGHYSSDGPPQLRKLFIGGLSHETTDDQTSVVGGYVLVIGIPQERPNLDAKLRQYYSQWGTVVDCIVIRDPQTKYSRGFGFVTFATVQMAEAAMADRPHTINNKVVDPKRAIPREQMSPLSPSNPPSFLEIEPDPGCKLSVSGIHWAWHTVDDLRQYFDSFGTVEQVEILGNPRGLGFVVFENKVSADKCLEHGKIHTINGQKCEITRNPIEHSIYQRNELYQFDSNDSEEIDEHVYSVDASRQQTPENGLVNAVENGSANGLILKEKNIRISYDRGKPQSTNKPQVSAGNVKKYKWSRLEEDNGKAVKKDDLKDRKIQLAVNDNKKMKKVNQI